MKSTIAQAYKWHRFNISFQTSWK